MGEFYNFCLQGSRTSSWSWDVRRSARKIERRSIGCSTKYSRIYFGANPFYSRMDRVAFLGQQLFYYFARSARIKVVEHWDKLKYYHTKIFSDQHTAIHRIKRSIQKEIYNSHHTWMIEWTNEWIESLNQSIRNSNVLHRFRNETN